MNEIELEVLTIMLIYNIYMLIPENLKCFHKLNMKILKVFMRMLIRENNHLFWIMLSIKKVRKNMKVTISHGKG